MRSNMIRFAAFDLILRLFFRSMMRIPFVIEIFRMHFDNRTRNPSGFRIPAYLIAYFKCLFHRLGLYGRIQVSSQIPRQCIPIHPSSHIYIFQQLLFVPVFYQQVQFFQDIFLLPCKQRR